MFMDIVFVVLHYIVADETCKCVSYIEKNIDTDNYRIVIVDNASPNGSGDILEKQYKDNLKVVVLKNQKNLGFARGNNVGYRYAKKYFKPQYLVMMNNDVYLLEKRLKEKLSEEFRRSGFYVLGPMIYTRDGRCDVNPDNAVFKNVADIDRMLHIYKKMYRRYKYYYAFVFYRLTPVIDMILGKKPVKKRKNFLFRAENVKLHGCFMVFSEKYILEYEGLDESTFLYWEEEFLYKHMMCNHKKTVYCPDIIVYHQEDAATDSIVAGERKKKMFLYEKYMESLEELRKLYIYYDSAL